MTNILIRPIITEKSMNEATVGKFSFEVLKSANKAEIAQAVKESFKVHPTKMQTITVPAKSKRSLRARKLITQRAWKKAIVTLKTGEKIDLFDITDQQPNA